MARHRRHKRGGRLGGAGNILVRVGTGVAIGAGAALVANKLGLGGLSSLIGLFAAYKVAGAEGAIGMAVVGGLGLNLGGLLGGMGTGGAAVSSGATFS